MSLTRSPPGDAVPTGARAIVLLAHGSRDPAWTQSVQNIADRVRADAAPGTDVCCAYLEHTQPSLEATFERLAASKIEFVRVFPLFIGMGHHLRSDIPERLRALRGRFPALQVELLPAAGENAAIIQALAQQALAPAALE